MHRKGSRVEGFSKHSKSCKAVQYSPDSCMNNERMKNLCAVGVHSFGRLNVRSRQLGPRNHSIGNCHIAVKSQSHFQITHDNLATDLFM
jgi:hypothetical protein